MTLIDCHKSCYMLVHINAKHTGLAISEEAKISLAWCPRAMCQFKSNVSLSERTSF